MAIQNDNTLVTKGDLKSLYTDKIAPYLGGGISYYHTDRTGEELKSCYATLSSNWTTVVNQKIPFVKVSGTFNQPSTGSFTIEAGQRIEFIACISHRNTSTTPDVVYAVYNDTDGNYISELAYIDPYGLSGLTYDSTLAGQWTNNTDHSVDISIRPSVVAIAGEVRTSLTSLSIKEIGRIVDPVKYVSNNSDLQETPVGNIISYMGNSVPKHYLACDGTAYAIGSYPELEQFIIDEFGSINYFGGNGSTTWAVPDLKGEFLRGSGTNSHTNNFLNKLEGSGASVGEHQDATVMAEDDSSWVAMTQGVLENNPTFDTKNGGQSRRCTDTGAQTDVAGYYITARPTNTSVQYCIKYESTYHAFFSNAAYKVSVAASVAASSAVQLIFDSSDIIGDSSLISGNSLVAPMDGWYSLGMNWSQSGSGDIGYYIRINGASGKGYNRGIFISDTLYLNKGDVITIWKESGSANSGRVNFCLLTSNYNPTIVSADSVYSENEQMIGYWKDGKPLYQKTLVFDNITITTTQQNLGDLSSLNIDYGTVVDVNGYENGDRYFLNSSFVRCWLRVPLNNIGFISTDGSRTFAPLYVTIKYTKTTDTASTLQIENSLLLNRPDLWTPETEYHFGGGLYGYRKTGTNVTVPKQSRTDIVLITTGNANTKIYNSGGFLENSDWKYTVPSSHTAGNGDQFIWFNKNNGSWTNNSIMFYISNNSTTAALNYTNYDVWVTYTK